MAVSNSLMAGNNVVEYKAGGETISLSTDFIKQYLAGSLYNAPFTINPYYAAQANYDTNGALDGESSYREQYYGGVNRGSGSDDPYEYLCANL